MKLNEGGFFIFIGDKEEIVTTELYAVLSIGIITIEKLLIKLAPLSEVDREESI